MPRTIRSLSERARANSLLICRGLPLVDLATIVGMVIKGLLILMVISEMILKTHRRSVLSWHLASIAGVWPAFTTRLQQPYNNCYTFWYFSFILQVKSGLPLVLLDPELLSSSGHSRWSSAPRSSAYCVISSTNVDILWKPAPTSHRFLLLSSTVAAAVLLHP